MWHYRIILLIAFTVLWTGIKLTAGERKFTYTYEAEVLPKGMREIEIWSTYHYRSASNRFANRIEFEWGLGSGLQTAFYLNTESTTAPAGSRTVLSVSNAWFYQLTAAEEQGISLALYGEWTVGAGEVAAEMKLLGHTFVGNALIAWNLTGEREWEQEQQEWEASNKVAFTGGLSLPLLPTVSGGIEWVVTHTFSASNTTATPLFLGPVLSFRQSRWWATMTFLPQIVDIERGGQNFQAADRWQWRLLLSWIL